MSPIPEIAPKENFYNYHGESWSFVNGVCEALSQARQDGQIRRVTNYEIYRRDLSVPLILAKADLIGSFPNEFELDTIAPPFNFQITSYPGYLRAFNVAAIDKVIK